MCIRVRHAKYETKASSVGARMAGGQEVARALGIPREQQKVGDPKRSIGKFSLAMGGSLMAVGSCRFAHQATLPQSPGSQVASQRYHHHDGLKSSHAACFGNTVRLVADGVWQ